MIKPETVTRILEARYASRSIASRPIPEEVIAHLITAVRLSPSCYNNQPWNFLFLLSPEALEKGRKCLVPGNLDWAGRAPLIVIAYARRKDDCVLKDGRAYYQFDTGMAVMNLMLAATANGLVARPMAGYNPTLVKESFGLDEESEPLIVLALGYYDSDESHLADRLKGANEKPRVRKAANEIVSML
jgi:nitroreductase